MRTSRPTGVSGDDPAASTATPVRTSHGQPEPLFHGAFDRRSNLDVPLHPAAATAVHGGRQATWLGDLMQQKSAAGAAGGPRPSTSAPGLATSAPGLATSAPGVPTAWRGRWVGRHGARSYSSASGAHVRGPSSTFGVQPRLLTARASSSRAPLHSPQCLGRVACRIWRVVDVGHDACLCYMAACNTSRVLVCAARFACPSTRRTLHAQVCRRSTAPRSCRGSSRPSAAPLPPPARPVLPPAASLVLANPKRERP